MHDVFPYFQPMQKQVHIDVLATGFKINFLRPTAGKLLLLPHSNPEAGKARITAEAEVCTISGAIKAFVSKMAATANIGGVGNAF